jgi:hypothetical protein
MDLESKFEHWCESLSEAQRLEVLTASGELPSWMVVSLQHAGIPSVPVLHSDRGPLDRGYRMPTQLRDFLEQRSETEGWRAMSASDDGVGYEVAARTEGTILVEFGPLTVEQKAFVDLHALRAVGTEPPALTDDNGVAIEFWRRDGETAQELYDDIRGWAIGNRLPVRGVIEI